VDDFVATGFGDAGAEHYDLETEEHQPLGPVVALLRDALLPAARVVEFGAGTGRVAAAFAAEFDGHVHGTDISTRMLDRLEARGLPNLTGEVHDVTAGPTGATYDGAFCVFNTLFMVGPVERQDAALRHMRRSVRDGGRLVLEVFEPSDPFFHEDQLHLEPQHLDPTSFGLTGTRIDAAARVMLMQRVMFTADGYSMAPATMHYRFASETDDAAADAGWRLRDRFAGWGRQPFGPRSQNAISVYEAV
jgi:SAM-dependent methyltransferase